MQQRQYAIHQGQQVQQPPYTMQPVQQPQYAMQLVQPVQQQVQQVQQIQRQQVQMQYPNQPQVMIVTQPSPQSLTDKFQNSARKVMTVLCSIQIAMGVLCIIFGIVVAALGSTYYRYDRYPANIGYGIWIGLYFTLVGGIGMGAVKSNTKGWIIGTMVLNIICSALWCIMLTSFNAAGLVVTSDARRCYSYFSSNCLGSNSITNTFYAMDSMLLIMSIIQFVITIWCAALCCGAVCRCCKGSMGGHMLQFNNAPVSTYSAYPVTQPELSVQQQSTVGVQHIQLGGMSAPPPSYTMQDPSTHGYATQNASAGGQAQDTQIMYEKRQPTA